MNKAFAGLRVLSIAACLAMLSLLIPAARAQDNAADFTVEDLLPDSTALLPLNDWTPLFIFSMTETADNPAPRILASLVFRIKGDPNAGDRSYDTAGGPIPSDLYQFGVFAEGGPVDDRGALDADDRLVLGKTSGNYTQFPDVPLVFDPDGNVFGTAGNIDNDPDPLAFDLDLSDFEINTTPGDATETYILAVRTSATWRNLTTLAYDVTDAFMRKLDGTEPVGTDGNPDTYNPDFGEGDNLNPETAYSSGFAVWDITSGASTSTWLDPEYANAWADPRTLYTPLAEYRRPRYDALGTAFDLVTGEFLELRRLFPLDQWTPVIGINIHATHSPRDRGDGGLINPRRTGPRLKEVNIILTDIGGDPIGPAGNGGFNPTQGLETLTHQFDSTGVPNPDESIRRDFGFNGLWVFHDTNGNGVFDQPAPLAGGGVSYAGGDYPMFPEGVFVDGQTPDNRVPGLPRWEYLPYPPGGGDPWWKLRLRFSDSGRRRDLTVAPEPDPAEAGFVEATPDGDQTSLFTGFVNDFFVVVRPDGGYDDIQTLPGDGVGMTMGGDFRAFIEPRRFNPNSVIPPGSTGQLDGGIYVSSQIPVDSFISNGVYLSLAWQEDPLWGPSEPWWPQRTLNETNAKPARSGAEIHDLVVSYETNNLFSQITDTDYGFGLGIGTGEFTLDVNDPFYPNFSRWLDPLALRAGTFQDVHPVGVVSWRTFINGNPSADDHLFNSFQYPYETVPFFIADHDLPPYGPRSAFFPSPPAQPTLPDYATWPQALLPGEYPRESHWTLANRKARYLKQHIEALSRPTAMIGINLVGADDPVVNANPAALIKLQQVTVAFWGPDFTPSDLLPLDPNGTSSTSGVLLVEDTSGNGAFGGSITTAEELSLDTPVRLTNLAWKTQPELVDLTGDGVADDLSGDGVVNAADKAWVLRLRPSAPWPVPVIDAPGGSIPALAPAAKSASPGRDEIYISIPEGEVIEADEAPKTLDGGTSYWAKVPVTLNREDEAAAVSTKAIGPAGHPGDDLFVVVRTSDTLKRFEQFRAVVPSTLPERIVSDRPAGIQLLPQALISQSLYQKNQPDEGPVQAYYGPVNPAYKPATPWDSYDFGYDLIEANVACKLVDLTGSGQTIVKNSGDVAVLGIDLSTNRGTAAGVAASGATGVGGPANFTVSGAGWTPAAFTGYFLIDAKYQSFKITGNTNNRLNLEATADATGTPASGPWKIAKDPSFLEQVIVEFYDVDLDGGFTILDDLLPLDIDPALSGVKLYRDNDNNPANANGVFDAGDLPVPLDYPPFQIGQAGEPDTQVMMVFSTPGTDNVPQPIQSQTRHRQWVPDTFGATSSDPALGPDFFVVISTSNDLDVGDDFRVGLVSWGPHTPTEPDPDTFPPPPATRVGEFDVFSEFPWGARAIGLITFFQTEKYYKQYPEQDNSGFNWVRSNVNKAIQTRDILAVQGTVQGDDVAITDVVPFQLPKNIPAGGLTLSITGVNFGTAPIASIDGVPLTIVSSSDTSIVATIPGGTVIDPDNNDIATLKVTNSTTGKFGLFSGFTIVPGGGGASPTITGVNPNQGTSSAFPVTITGTNFDNPKVFFGGTRMPVQSWTPTSIVVGFPVGGLPVTGYLDVKVQNQTSGLFAILANGFRYINVPTGGGGTGGGSLLPGGGLPTCFIATAAYGSPFASKLDTFRDFRDAVLLKSAPGAAAVDLYYRVSPPIADQVGKSPALAAVVRIVLTPVAWVLEVPALLLLPATMAGAAFLRVRRKRRAARIG